MEEENNRQPHGSDHPYSPQRDVASGETESLFEVVDSYLREKTRAVPAKTGRWIAGIFLIGGWAYVINGFVTLDRKLEHRFLQTDKQMEAEAPTGTRIGEADSLEYTNHEEEESQ